ncbi:STAS domain-containing protein [Geodermatophilus obscurus]|uniref:STAS domain-containing protein n=1 Tax=Geodermatophilus obscurus TaxID=1861 RepID=UPI0011410785|nr:STAS domain-containing protein [Geodermatophilus obscurus]
MRVQRNRLRPGGAPAGTTSARHQVQERGIDAVPGAPVESTVCVDRSRPRPVVSVIGALDTSGAALLSAMLDHVRRTEGRTVVVDLTRVDYVDSHGLAPVLDVDVTVCGASPSVTRLLELLGRPLPVTARGAGLLGVPALSGPRAH